MPSPINKVNYLFRKNLENEQKLQAGYYREVINHYGIPVIYFRYNLDYYKSPSGSMANYVYGESPTSNYPLSAEMIIFDSFNDDSPLLKRFGIESVAKSEIYFMIDDFTETWRDIIGTPTTGILTSFVSGEIQSFSGLISGNVINNDLSGFVQSNITIQEEGEFISGISLHFNRYPVPLNDLLAKPSYYTEQYVSGSLDGNISGNIDLSGNGIVYGNVSGILYYFTSPSVNHGPHFQISPQVGDFIRLKEFDSDVDNYEEYEITQILDKNLSRSGLNPLLKRYIWGCTVVRRDPSHENIEGNLQQEKFTPNMLPHNEWIETSSNKIFDYDTKPVDKVDKVNADSVYGDYDK